TYTHLGLPIRGLRLWATGTASIRFTHVVHPSSSAAHRVVALPKTKFRRFHPRFSRLLPSAIGVTLADTPKTAPSSLSSSTTRRLAYEVTPSVQCRRNAIVVSASIRRRELCVTSLTSSVSYPSEDEDRKPAVPQGTKRRKPERHLAVAATRAAPVSNQATRSIPSVFEQQSAPPKSPDVKPLMLSYNHDDPAGRPQMRIRPFLNVDNDGKIDLTSDIRAAAPVSNQATRSIPSVYDQQAPPKSPDGMPIMLSYNHGGPSPAGRPQMRNRPFLKVDNDGKIDLTNDDTDDDES
ncbi:hypothetical protein THAOC_26231, partial [Thalassiosira oceanica]